MELSASRDRRERLERVFKLECNKIVSFLFLISSFKVIFMGNVRLSRKKELSIIFSSSLLIENLISFQDVDDYYIFLSKIDTWFSKRHHVMEQPDN